MAAGASRGVRGLLPSRWKIITLVRRVPYYETTQSCICHILYGATGLPENKGNFYRNTKESPGARGGSSRQMNTVHPGRGCALRQRGAEGLSIKRPMTHTVQAQGHHVPMRCQALRARQTRSLLSRAGASWQSYQGERQQTRNR